MLHFIRASVRELHGQAAREPGTGLLRMERCLARQLRRAMDARSALGIAVALGCAAEFRIFPDDETLEACTNLVQLPAQRALRCIVWAARHRCRKEGKHVHRFRMLSYQGRPPGSAGEAVTGS